MSDYNLAVRQEGQPHPPNSLVGFAGMWTLALNALAYVRLWQLSHDLNGNDVHDISDRVESWRSGVAVASAMSFAGSLALCLTQGQARALDRSINGPEDNDVGFLRTYRRLQPTLLVGVMSVAVLFSALVDAWIAVSMGSARTDLADAINDQQGGSVAETGEHYWSAMRFSIAAAAIGFFSNIVFFMWVLANGTRCGSTSHGKGSSV